MAGNPFPFHGLSRLNNSNGYGPCIFIWRGRTPSVSVSRLYTPNLNAGNDQIGELYSFVPVAPGAEGVT
jgi:hypothetical protein